MKIKDNSISTHTKLPFIHLLPEKRKSYFGFKTWVSPAFQVVTILKSEVPAPTGGQC